MPSVFSLKWRSENTLALANLSLPGANTFDQGKGLVSLVAAFSASCSQAHYATLLKWRMLSSKETF